MNEELKNKVELLVRNCYTVKASAMLDFPEAADLAGLIFTANNREADEDTIRANRKILKSKAGTFNNLRNGCTNLTVLANMSMNDDPEKYVDDVLAAYDAIKQQKTFRGENLVFAAMGMVDMLSPSEYQAAADKAWELLDQMAEEHPLITSQDDYTMAFLLSQSNLDVNVLLEEAEKCYEVLKGEHFKLNKDTLQTISLVLAMSSKPTDEKCQKFLELREALDKAGHKLASMEQAIIAAFVDDDLPVEQVVTEIGDTDDYLKKQKGFHGLFGCGAQMRRLFACALVLQTHQEDNSGAYASNAVAMYVTQQIIAIIMMMIVTTTVTATAVTVSSH